MKVEVGNLFDTARLIKADCIAITTNGVVKRDGTAVMGAGVAKLAAMRWGELPRLLAQKLRSTGKNSVHYLGNFRSNPRMTGTNMIDVCSFPTKHHWKNSSDIRLIKRSAWELVALADKHQWKDIVLSPPGCGNGGLKWSEVEKEIRLYFDDRFTIVFLER